MNSTFGFILKVLLASTALSLVIKYGGPLLAVPATSTSALISVLLPTAVLAMIFAWQGLREKRSLEER